MFKERILESAFTGLKLMAEMPAHAMVHAVTEGLPWWLKAAIGATAFMAALALPILVELLDRSRRRETPPPPPQTDKRRNKRAKK